MVTISRHDLYALKETGFRPCAQGYLVFSRFLKFLGRDFRFCTEDFVAFRMFCEKKYPFTYNSFIEWFISDGIAALTKRRSLSFVCEFGEFRGSYKNGCEYSYYGAFSSGNSFELNWVGKDFSLCVSFEYYWSEEELAFNPALSSLLYYVRSGLAESVSFSLEEGRVLYEESMKAWEDMKKRVIREGVLYVTDKVEE